MSKRLIIFHGGCADGHCAAWALSDNGNDYLAAHYGDAPPDVTGKDVIIADFSYSRDELLKMASTARSIVVLDHHASSQRALEGLSDEAPNITTVFDMSKSGAILAWEYQYGLETPPPALLLHVQDRDLWRFELADTKAIMHRFFLDGLACDERGYPVGVDRVLSVGFPSLRSEGALLLEQYEAEVESIVRRQTSLELVGAYRIPMANVPARYASDVGSRLAKGQPFAGTYQIIDGTVRVSLRSTPEGIDVSEIAESFGGGGHRNAAGYTCSVSQFFHGSK